MVRVVSQRFWCIRPPKKLRDADYAEWNDEVRFEKIICPLNDYHTHPGRRLTDLSVTFRMSRPKDFVWTWLGDLLCTEEALHVLRDAKITGFEARPAAVKRKSRVAANGALPNYYEVAVTGWGGMAAPESGLELLKFCPACHLREYKVADPTRLIAEATWDGSDFFIVWPMPLYPFVSDRVAELLRSRKFSGIDIVPADKVFPGATKFGPGRLSYCFSEERARRLGEPLGIY